MILALVALFATVLTGAAVLGLWIEPVRSKIDRRATALGLAHVAAALAAVVLWVAFAIVQSRAMAWISSGLLAVTVALGVSTLISSRARERPATAGGPEPVPTPALVVHAATATIAVALCALAIIRR